MGHTVKAVRTVKVVRVLKNKVAFGRCAKDGSSMCVWVNGHEIIRISYNYELMGNAYQHALAKRLAESFGYRGEYMPGIIDKELLARHSQEFEAQFSL